METAARRRWFGVVPPVWGIAGVVLTVLAGGLILALGAGSARPSSDPDADGLVGSVDPADAELGARPTTTSASAMTTTGLPSMSTPADGGGTPTGAPAPPPGAPALRLEVVTSPNILTGWLVTVTVTNPATVAQTWTNVSVQAADVLPATAVESHTPGTRGYGSGTLACVEPTGAAAIAAGSSLSIDFSVNVNVDISQPKAQVNDSSCLPPRAT